MIVRDDIYRTHPRSWETPTDILVSSVIDLTRLVGREKMMSIQSFGNEMHVSVF